MADRKAIASGLSLSEIGTGGGSGAKKTGGGWLVMLVVVPLVAGPLRISYCSAVVGGKVVVVGDGEEAGGPMDARPGTGARFVKTGVTGEYGGGGGVPGRSWLRSWLFMELMPVCPCGNTILD